jgi:hypothetical protein
MIDLTKEIKTALMRPQGRLARFIDTAFLFICGIAMALVYYSINYELCIANKCNDLVITRYWVSSSFFYLLFSAALAVTSIFIYRSRELPRLYCYAITIGMAAGVVLSGMMLFAITREINLYI